MKSDETFPNDTKFFSLNLDHQRVHGTMITNLDDPSKNEIIRHVEFR